MSYEKVIQDSDDEGDMLAGDPHPVDPSGDASQHEDHNINGVNGDVGNGLAHHPVPNATPGSQMGINFDQFIQSPETAQHQITASQQQREERWIPTAGMGGSVGAMMTEIDLAQRRLLDDNSTSCSDQQLPPTAPPVELMHHDFHAYAQETEMHNIGDNDINAIDGGHDRAEVPKDPDMPTERNDYVLQHEEAVNGNGHGHGMSNCDIANSSVSNGYTQSNGSYNIFESLKESTSTDNNIGNSNSTAEFKDRVSHKSPYRSKSMQATPQSPHDTEPNPSVLSSKLSRARSDNPNISRNGSAHPHSSSRSTDELSAPVTIEVPLKKRRGRKRKHPSSEEQDQEDDELANANDQEPEPKKQDKTEKRKPGRPRSDAKSQTQKTKDNKPNGHAENGPIEATEPKDVPSNTSEPAEAPNLAKSNPPEPETIASPQKPNTPTKRTSKPIPSKDPNPSPEHAFAIPTKPASSLTSGTKEPRAKKQKLKRGKTTSLTVKRTYSADVEDDVIWVDERPPPGPVDPKFKPSAEPSLSGSGSSSNVNGTEDVSGKAEQVKDLPSTIQATQGQGQGIQGDGSAASNSTSHVEPAQGPKKRGRKRKKTSEQLAEEAQARSQTETQAQPAEMSDAKRQGEPTVEIPAAPEPTAIPAAESEPEPTKQQPSLPEAQDTENPMNGPELEAVEDNPNASANSDPNGSISPTKKTGLAAPETPKKQTSGTFNQSGTDADKENCKGPEKHSPISGTSKVPYRVGLSRRARIAPLLKMVRR